jgi:hypothetical protein
MSALNIEKQNENDELTTCHASKLLIAPTIRQAARPAIARNTGT